MSREVIEVKPTKSWWAGDNRVEKFMPKVSAAIERSGASLTQDQKTDIYNRAYEAVYAAILEFDKKKVIGEK